MRGLHRYNVARLLAVFLLLTGVLLCASDAFASNCVTRPNIPNNPLDPTAGVMPVNPSGGPPGTPYLDPAKPYGWMTNRLVGCFEDTVYLVGLTSYSGFRLAMRNTILATLTLYIVLFSVKASFKAFKQSEAAEFAILAMKFAGVTYFVVYGGVEYFMPSFFFALQWFTNIVGAAMPAPAVCSDSRIWLRLDCSLGLTWGGSLTGWQDPWALFSVAGQSFFTANGLIIVGLVGVMFIFVLCAVATSILAYMMCLIALAVLLMISPIIIPMYLFSFTQPIFVVWFRMLFGYMLQPMVLFGYLAFMMHVIGFIAMGPPGAGPNTVLGIVPILADITGTVNSPTFVSHRTVWEGQTSVEAGATTPTPGQAAEQQNVAVEAWSFVVADFSFQPSVNNPCAGMTGRTYQDCRQIHLNINLIILIITMAMSLSFMSSVMDKAGEMVGAQVSATFMKNINIYGQAVQFSQAMVKDVTTAVATGGSDLSFKSTISQAASAAKDI